MSLNNPTVIHNSTDKELINSVYHEFPRLKGLLKQLANRFEEIVDQFDLEAKSIDCPQCGTTVILGEKE